MHGNFITLTNLSASDIDMIIKSRLEPLHISIHSFDPGIRNILFGNKNNLKAIKFFKRLDDAGIRTNIQIVLVPGLNDSQDLKNTIERLYVEYKYIDSIGVVPVGVTRYNKDKNIRPFRVEEIKQTIALMDRLKKRHEKNLPEIVFLSDEFYILAGKNFPPFESYGKFFQINNGIGKSSDFLNEIKNDLNKILKKNINRGEHAKLLLITSEYGAIVLEKAIYLIMDFLKDPILQRINTPIDIEIVKNNYLGGNVKVTGLLAGADIIESINSLNTELYDLIFIPDSIFNNDGLTIDGINKNEIETVNRKIRLIPEDGKNFLKEIVKNLYKIKLND